MERKSSKKDLRLLPRYFKLIGLIVMIIAFVPAVTVFSIQHIEMSAQGKELLKTCTFDVFILGMVFIAWSKDKIEDELTFAIRLKAMAFAFLFTIFYVMMEPLSDFIFKMNYDLTARYVVFLMLLEYLIFYYWQKRFR